MIASLSTATWSGFVRRDQRGLVRAPFAVSSCGWPELSAREHKLLTAIAGRSCADAAGLRRCRASTAPRGRARSLWPSLADPTRSAKPARPGLPTIGAVGGTHTPSSIESAANKIGVHTGEPAQAGTQELV